MGNSAQEVYLYKPCSPLTCYPKPRLWLDPLNTQVYISLSCQFLTNLLFLCLESNKKLPALATVLPTGRFFFPLLGGDNVFPHIKFISFVCNLLCHSMCCEGATLKQICWEEVGQA